MRIIGRKDELNFVLYNSFESRLFSPIGKYVSWKLENMWDDYNELYHAVRYIEDLKSRNGIWYEIHTLERNKEIKGVLTIVGGDIPAIESEKRLDLENTLLLKYFHILEKGKGHGSYWLNSIVLPHYSEKGFSNIHVSSSHPKSFDFYKKIGAELNSYTKMSDNGLYERKCKSFLINIDR